MSAAGADDVATILAPYLVISERFRPAENEDSEIVLSPSRVVTSTNMNSPRTDAVVILLFTASWVTPSNEALQMTSARLIRQYSRLSCIFFSADVDENCFTGSCVHPRCVM
jgi:hypothetical protein